MAMPVQPLYIGVDVSRPRCPLSQSRAPVQTFAQSTTLIAQWLTSLPPVHLPGCRTTNTFHLDSIERRIDAATLSICVDGYR